MSISEVDSPPRSIPTPRAPEVHNKESNTAALFLESSSMATTTESKRNIPTWVWIVLAFAIVGVSSAGTLFQQVSEVPPILRASWRLQSTSVLLIPFAVWEWKTCVQSIRNRCFERDTLAILVASSIAVAAHFGLWVVSLDLTTLTHALLYISTSAIATALCMIVLNYIPVACLQYLALCNAKCSVRIPNRFENLGVVLGLIGAGLTTLDFGTKQGSNTATFLGDFLAFLGAIAFIFYQVCGRILRSWMPIFMYSLPVNVIGSLILMAVSAIFEKNAKDFGMFGWLTRAYIGWFALLAVVAGFIGHAGLNTCLSYMSPLLVCSATTLEPVIGTLIGWLIFNAGVPGTWSIIGGSLLTASFLVVTYGNAVAQDPLKANEDPSNTEDLHQSEVELSTMESAHKQVSPDVAYSLVSREQTA